MPTPPSSPGNEDVGLNVELPEDSLFDIEDYLEMYRVASSQPAFAIMRALREEGKLSTSELEELLNREANNLHYYLRQLKRYALIKNRRDPTTGTAEPYSYYILTDLGHLVLTEGLETSIKQMATEERTLAAKDGN